MWTHFTLPITLRNRNRWGNWGTEWVTNPLPEAPSQLEVYYSWDEPRQPSSRACPWPHGQVTLSGGSLQRELMAGWQCLPVPLPKYCDVQILPTHQGEAQAPATSSREPPRQETYQATNCLSWVQELGHFQSLCPLGLQEKPKGVLNLSDGRDACWQPGKEGCGLILRIMFLNV